jgi:hypothetical protein
VTEERPPNAGGIGPLKRLGVIVVVVVFTWWVERGFKALIAALS